MPAFVAAERHESPPCGPPVPMAVIQYRVTDDDNLSGRWCKSAAEADAHFGDRTVDLNEQVGAVVPELVERITEWLLNGRHEWSGKRRRPRYARRSRTRSRRSSLPRASIGVWAASQPFSMRRRSLARATSFKRMALRPDHRWPFEGAGIPLVRDSTT